VEQQLLQAHLPVLLERGFDNLMAEERVADLARLYNLAGRIQALEAVRQALRQYVRTSGSAIVMDEEKVRGSGRV
jgi:cullin 4